MYYNKEGKLITCEQYLKLITDKNYKFINFTILGDGKWVSTVWLGMNYNFDDDIPLIFETMVFPSKDNYEDIDCDRYSTLEEAIAGHQKMIDKWNN
jgi:hypothetical protein